MPHRARRHSRTKALLCAIILIVLIPSAGYGIFIAVFVRPPSYSPSAQYGDLSIDLRTWAEHDAIVDSAASPYVLRLEGAGVSVLYFGAAHTNDAAHPQHAEIERHWKDFAPTVALCEGRARFFRFASRKATGTLRETDLTAILARRAGVQLYSLEPTFDDEVSALCRAFEPRVVAAFMILRAYTSEVKSHKGDRDALALHLLRKRTRAPQLRDTLQTVDDLDTFWREYCPGQQDWRTIPDTDSVPSFASLGDHARRVRGEHMVRTIVDLTRRGERVFAVVGASHVIRQEPALRRALESGPHSAPHP